MKTRQQQLEATIKTARDELQSMQAQEDQRENEKLIGNCYVYRNCYSCPQAESDYWNLYVRVIGVQDGNINMVQFQVDKYGAAIMERQLRTSHMFADGGFRPISLADFQKAWFAFLSGPVKSFGADVEKKIKAMTDR